MSQIFPHVYISCAEIALWLWLVRVWDFFALGRGLQILILHIAVAYRWKQPVWAIWTAGTPLRVYWPIVYLLASVLITVSGLRASMIIRVCVSAMYEEILFRYIIPRLVNSRVMGAVCGVALFTFAHRGVSWEDAVVCAISGFALNLRMGNRKCLFETFAIHALHNLHVGIATNEFSARGYWVPIILYGTMIFQEARSQKHKK